MSCRAMQGIVVGLILVGSVTVTAGAEQPAAKSADKPAPAVSAADGLAPAPITQMKQEMGALNLQGVTVQVLAMQYQKEMNNLQQMQTVFCEAHKLDVAKFRQGKYRYNEKEGQFVEQETPSQP